MQQVAKQQQQTKEEQQETVEEEVAQETTQYTTSHIETIETVPVPVQDPIVCCVAVG